MSMFAQFATSTAAAALATESSADPLAQAVDAGFAQERQAHELEQEAQQTAEAVQADVAATLAGEDAGATQEGAPGQPNVDLPEGEFGDDADKKESGDDVKVNADDTEATFNNEVTTDDIVDGDDAADEDDNYDDDVADIEMLAGEMSQLIEASVAIESYGMSKSTMAIMQISGLLSGTALESLGLESVSMSAGHEPESVMAMEALGEKVKEKAAAFAAKVLGVVKGGAEKVQGVMTSLWDSISETSSKLTAKTWDAAKSAAATVRAHPYKTIAAVVGSIAVVAGIVAFMTGAPAMGAKVDVLKAFAKKIVGDIGKIKFPGGAIKATLNEAGTKIVLGFTKAKAVAESAGLKTLGWSQSAVKAIEGQLGRAWQALKTGYAGMTKRAASVGGVVSDVAKQYSDSTVVSRFAAQKTAGATGKAAAGTAAGAAVGVTHAVGSMVARNAAITAYFTFLVSVVGAVLRLVQFVVLGGLRMIAATFRALLPASQPAAA